MGKVTVWGHRVKQGNRLLLFQITCLIVWLTGSRFAASQESLLGESASQDALFYQASISVAEKSLRLNESQDAYFWLQQAPEHLRGWEWRYLSSISNQSLADEKLTHQATCIAMDSAQRQLAIGYMNGSLELRSIPEMSVVKSLEGHTDAVYAASFAPDGKTIVTVSRDTSVRTWDTDSGAGKLLHALDNPGVAATTFSPDGTKVATCTWMMVGEGESRTVCGVVWIVDAQSGEVVTKSRVGGKPWIQLTGLTMVNKYTLGRGMDLFTN